MWKLTGVASARELLVSCGANQAQRITANPRIHGELTRGERHVSSVGGRLEEGGDDFAPPSSRSASGSAASAAEHAVPEQECPTPMHARRNKRNSMQRCERGGWLLLALDESLETNVSRPRLSNFAASLIAGATAEKMSTMASRTWAPELCHVYQHDVEFHDMGKYSFKGKLLL